MSQADNSLILIPARMKSVRLPGKPMADINGMPMICQVYERALQSGIGQPWVATDSEEILKAIEACGGRAVMTKADHESGSDRIWEATKQIDSAEEKKFIINLQGDLPAIDSRIIRQSLQLVIDGPADIGTLGVEITDESKKLDPDVVKMVASEITPSRMRAIYFTRAPAPWGKGPSYHHVGIYAYRRAALEKFVSLKPSKLEKQEKLEQLRAIEAGMRIDVSIIDTLPLSVDTKKDLERARAIFRQTDNLNA